MAGRDAFNRVRFLSTTRWDDQQVLTILDCSARLGTSRLVTLDMPPALSERVMNALKADPRTVDLRALAPHFYSLGERILELFEEEEMVDVLTDVCYKLSKVGLCAVTRFLTLLILDLQKAGGRNFRPRSQSAWCRWRWRGVPTRSR